MNISALFKSLRLRKFATGLLLLQLSLTISLLVNTVILTNSAIEKLSNPLGFPVDRLLIIDSIPTSGAFRDTDYFRSIVEQDLAKISALDGVVSASHYNQLPIQRGGSNGNVQAADFPEDGILEKYLRYVPQFFSSANGLENLGIEIIDGRALNASDDFTNDYYNPEKRDDVVSNIVLTESLAKAVFPNKPALGELTNNGRVVGIAKDFIISPGHPKYAQSYGVFGNFLVSQADRAQHYIVQVEPSQLERVKAQLSDTVLSVQAERDILSVDSMSNRLTKFYSRDTGLASFFAILSMLIVGVTIVSSFAHAHFHVTQQRKFIGIRRALGARKKDIMIYVFSENWLLSLLASVLGIGTALLLNMGLSEVITIDKPSILLYCFSVLVIFISGSLATWLPAYQTTKISPVTATRTL